ncbi:MAG: Fe-S cluster assembly ATPase SufC [Pseudomonadota bacterium]
MLEIHDLHAAIDGKEILKGLSLTLGAGEVHAIMGPNGSGKSTLANVLAGHPAYEVTGGSVTFHGQDLLAMPVEERARAGLFLSFQYPVEIPGVSTASFLKAALNAVREHRGLDPLDGFDFLEKARAALAAVNMDEAFLKRSLNEGFSGGEKKRSEIFQMALLEPSLAVLDETDSGLDIDALREVAAGITAQRRPDRAMLVITHYQRLLDHLVPDRVHVLADGRILRAGGEELVRELEREGYAGILRAAGLRMQEGGGDA